MSDYYQDILKQIDEAIERKDYKEAFSTLKKELQMPYIPLDIEKEFKNRLQDVQFFQHDSEHDNTPSLDTLLDLLQGDAKEQLAAVAQLEKHNLRDCIPEIRKYLESDPYEEAAAYLIECIAEQQINDDFIWNRNGVEYAFYGDSLTPCAQSEGFIKANGYLKEWFSKNIDMYEMAKTLLVHEVYMFLPLSYEADEAMMLAFDIFEEVCEMMGQDALVNQIRDKLQMSVKN